MFEDRAPDPIARLGPTRDRPFEATHFDRVEAGRRASDDRRGRRGASRSRPALRAPDLRATHPASTPDDPPSVGTHLDVRA